MSSIFAVVILTSLLGPASSGAAPKGLRLMLGASYTNMNTTLASEYRQAYVADPTIRSAVDEFNAMIQGIDQSLGLGGGVGWQFQGGFGFFASAGYSRASATDVSTATNEIGQVLGEIETEYRITTVPVSLGADYRAYRGRFATVLDVAFQVNFLDFSAHLSNPEISKLPESSWSLGDETALGGSVGLALEWVPVPQFSAGARAGYKVAESVRLWEYDVDLSGPSFTVYVEYRPWWTGQTE